MDWARQINSKKAFHSIDATPHISTYAKPTSRLRKEFQTVIHLNSSLMPRPVTEEDLGLNIVYQPEGTNKSEDIELEIIAVHGLGAHPNDTWTAPRNDGGTVRRINWLCEKDMLPTSTPKARIWQFGYRSQWFGNESLRTTASNIAKMLLAEIKARNLIMDRPIIFISHSFGGLVVLKTISLSFYHRSLCDGLFGKVGGLIFFGTPFRGARGLSIDNMILAALSVFDPQDIEPQALEIMQPGSEVLLELVDDFCSIWSRDGKRPIHCFYELQPSEVGKLVGKERLRAFVVDETAGCLDLFPGVSKRALQKNHFNMNKFSSPSEVEFRRTKEDIAWVAQIAIKNFQKESFGNENSADESLESASTRTNRTKVSEFSQPGTQGTNIDQHSAPADRAQHMEESNHMPVSVIYPELLASHQISIGRLVRDIEEPDGDFFDPERKVPQHLIGIASHVSYEEVQPSSTESLPATLSQLCSESRTKKLAISSRVTADRVTTYRLRNPRSWFDLIIQDRSTREWIEESAQQGDDVYLVVGFHMMKNATFTEYAVEQQMAQTQQTYGIFDDGRSVQRRFMKEGDHICAIRYQKVCYSCHSSQELDTAWLTKENFWRNYWTLRGYEKGVDDVMEAYLQGHLELSDRYRFYSDGNECFQY